MDEIYECERWINNLFRKVESLWEELEEFKEPVSYYGRVGESVKKLYADAVKEIPLRHSDYTDLVETSTSSTLAFKDNTVHSNLNKIKEAPLVPTEFSRKQITSEISGPSVEEGNSLIKKNSNKGIRVHLDSFTNSQEDVGSSKLRNSSESFMYTGCVEKKYDADWSAKILNELSENYFDNRSEDGIFCDASSVTDGTIFQDADWDIAELDMYNECIKVKCDDNDFVKISNKLSGNQFSNTMEEEGTLSNASLETGGLIFDADWNIPYTVDQNFGIDKKNEGDPLVNLEEKKKFFSSCICEPENDSDTSSAHQSSKLESAIACNRSKEENPSHFFDSSSLPVKLYDSANSSSRNFTVEPDQVSCNPSESGDSFSVTSQGFSLCGSFTVLGRDCNNEGFSDVDFEDLKMDTIDLSAEKQPVESSIIVESGKPPTLRSSKMKSYKKMIKDTFMLRKKVTKEYKKLPMLYADIEKELSQLTEETLPKTPAHNIVESDWELV